MFRRVVWRHLRKEPDFDEDRQYHLQTKRCSHYSSQIIARLKVRP